MTNTQKKSLVGRILKWFGIILLVLLVLIISAPFLFKNQIVQFVKDTANKELNAKVNFGDFDLSLFRSFPDFSLSVDNVSIANIGEFEGDTLLAAKNLSIGLNLMSVIKGDKYEINEISLDQPRIEAIVLKNGKANWDITKPSADTTKETPAADSKPFKMGLKKFEIKNGHIVYDDASLGFKTELVGMNYNLKGDFSEDIFDIETLLEVDKMSMAYGGISYMNKVKTRVKAGINANMPQFKFILKENEFSLNELTLGLDGSFAMPKDDMDMDLTFKANQTEFKNILSLIPGVYTADFKDVKTAGKLTLNGFVKGIYNDKKMPAFACKLLIQDAMFQYPSLPKAANNIFVDLDVNNKTGVPDATVIDLNKFHVELGGNPVNAIMHVSTPVSDANIDGEVKAKINLATIKDIIPLEKGDALTGLITADVKMKGRMSSIDKKEYEKFDAKGQLSILDMNYKSAGLNYPTTISKLYLDFTPQYVDLTQLEAKVGKSDFNMKGKIENFLQYALKDELLKGSFNLNSSLIDLNEFMTSEEEAPKTPEAETPMTVIEVPANLDVNLTATIGKLIYDNLNMTAISGGVGVKDSKVSLNNFKVNALEGTMAITGIYATQNVKKPTVDFDVDISNFDITKTFETFNTVQKLAPIAKYAKGKFGTQLKFAATLDEHMEPVLPTLTGGGKLQTKNVVVEGFEPINKLADALKQEKYKRIAFENVNASYKFVNGRVEVDEMPIKSGNIAGFVKGSTGFDQTIDYTWKLEIPRAEFGSQLNNAANSLLAEANKKAGTNVSLGEKINIKALFGGTITKPTIKTDLIGGEKSTKETVKEAVTKGVEVVKGKAKEEAEKIMKDAQEQADRIKAEAKVAADKAREEGYKAVDQTIENAKNPIAKGAAKLAAPAAKKEVDKKVQKIQDDANKKADDILLKAKAESDKKLQ
jgi:vacuolar-type H+-ATPase subunit H